MRINGLASELGKNFLSQRRKLSTLVAAVSAGESLNSKEEVERSIGQNVDDFEKPDEGNSLYQPGSSYHRHPLWQD